MIETLINRLITLLTKLFGSMVVIGEHLHTTDDSGIEEASGVVVAAFPDINIEATSDIAQ